MRNPKAKVSDPNKFYTNPGEDVKVIYSAKILPTGEVRLTPAGKESMSEKINAEKQYTDINYIINRLSMGDTSVIKNGQAVYGDFTMVPKTMAETVQMMNDAKDKFYELPLDVRQKFNNSYEAWLMQAGSPDWLKAMQMEVKEDVTEIVKEEGDVVES